MATLNALAYRFSPSWSVLVLHRYYAKDFEGIHARAFEEGGRVRNENGLYVGMEAALGDKLKATAYVDCFRFPAPKYRVSVPGSKEWKFSRSSRGVWESVSTGCCVTASRIREKILRWKTMAARELLRTTAIRSDTVPLAGNARMDVENYA